MLTELTFNLKELEMLVDALACLRRDEDEMRKMGHSHKEVSDLRAGIRRAMADYPDMTCCEFHRSGGDRELSCGGDTAK